MHLMAECSSSCVLPLSSSMRLWEGDNCQRDWERVEKEAELSIIKYLTIWLILGSGNIY